MRCQKSSPIQGIQDANDFGPIGLRNGEISVEMSHDSPLIGFPATHLTLATRLLRPDRLAAAFAGADADAIVEGEDENLAVADLAGLRRAGGVDDGFDGG